MIRNTAGSLKVTQCLLMVKNRRAIGKMAQRLKRLWYNHEDTGLNPQDARNVRRVSAHL